MVLERWLDQLDVPTQDRPADVQAKADLVRRRVRGRAVVVLQENATSAAQVKPLLPDSPGSVVLMTGPSEPPALHSLLDFESVRLDPLADEHALELLVKISRSTEDPETFRPLLPHVGGLPLLLRLLAGHLRSPVPGVVEDVVARLSDRTERQELLHRGGAGDGDDGSALFEWLDFLYGRLPDAAARLYRRLGVHPRVDFPLDTVYALAPDLDAATVRPALHSLLRDGLLERWGVDTYCVHALVHDHASTTAEQVDSATERAAVEDRLVAYYLDIAERGEAALSTRYRYDPMGVYTPGTRPAPAWAAQAEKELGRRRAGLLAALDLAARTDRHMEAWRLSQALWTFQLRTGSHAEWIDSRRIGTRSARACGDRLAEARMEYEWGFGHLDRWSVEEDDPRQAREHLEKALGLVRPEAPDRGECERRTASSAQEALGLLELKLKRPRQALDRFDEALAALDGIDHPRGRALLAYHRGRAYTALNRHNDAEPALSDARDGFTRLPGGPDGFNIAKTWWRFAEDRRACGSSGPPSRPWAGPPPAWRPREPRTSMRWSFCSGATSGRSRAIGRRRSPTGGRPARPLRERRQRP